MIKNKKVFLFFLSTLGLLVHGMQQPTKEHTLQEKEDAYLLRHRLIHQINLAM